MLLQDLNSALSRWFASRVDARRVVRDVCEGFTEAELTEPHNEAQEREFRKFVFGVDFARQQYVREDTRHRRRRDDVCSGGTG
jgi:hypothetical protein